MRRRFPWFTLVLMGASALAPVAGKAQSAPANSDPPAGKLSKKQQKQDKKLDKASDKKKSQRALFNELGPSYKKWLDEDVPYIITDQERRSFLQLATNEEREQFIEEFWQRRNPEPDSTENTFKEEYYRRIAYANEHFATGTPGWKSDRGRMYIMWGPPDSIVTHSQGEIWDRPPELGGGSTKTWAYDEWNYNYLEGIGNNVKLEFVDDNQSGGYRYTNNPSDKDAFNNVPSEGLTQMEQEGLASRNNRMYDPGMNPTPMTGFLGAEYSVFDRLDQEGKLFTPPQVKFKDLEAIVTSRIIRDQLQFTYRFDFMRISGDTVLVPVTVQIPNSQMSFQSKDGVHTANLDLFARVSTLSGRVVQTFEDNVRRDFPDSLFQQSVHGSSIYQKALPLRPGLYRLDIVLKDLASNNVGTINTRLAVPAIDEDKLAASSMILADSMSPVAAKDIGIGQFVIGSTKVRPKVDQAFSPKESMGVYMQFYNLKVDDTTHKNDATVDIEIFQGDRSVSRVERTSAQLKQNGEELTVQQVVPMARLTPGKYRIEVKATDGISKQTVSRSADFTVTPADAAGPVTSQ